MLKKLVIILKILFANTVIKVVGLIPEVKGYDEKVITFFCEKVKKIAITTMENQNSDEAYTLISNFVTHPIIDTPQSRELGFFLAEKLDHLISPWQFLKDT